MPFLKPFVQKQMQQTEEVSAEKKKRKNVFSNLNNCWNDNGSSHNYKQCH